MIGQVCKGATVCRIQRLFHALFFDSLCAQLSAIAFLLSLRYIALRLKGDGIAFFCEGEGLTKKQATLGTDSASLLTPTIFFLALMLTVGWKQEANSGLLCQSLMFC